MTPLVTLVLGLGTVILDICIVLGFFALLARETWGREVVRWLGKHALWFGLALALLALVGSLTYSNVIGYTPCDLCWWQRICLYPLTAIFAVALYKKRHDAAYLFALPLASIAAVIASYQTYIQLGGPVSLGGCTAVGGACAKVFVLAFGYVTIPTMALTIALGVILLAFMHKHHENRHS